ncbi:MAG TPA: alcohol dehydrogenase catalytic domain-containing protein [Spirochaetia bacterium]|nr:alcohol dehydrogenase catalytic domain-containing protein [Spirochaetia bacterium]
MEFLEQVPREILSWQLKGSGLENLGSKGRPETVPFPRYTEDDLIARIDAVGLCFSDIKLISAGNTHPRIEGRDLAKNPTVPGHEISMTIVGIGDNRKGQFALGQRCIIQADVYYKGKGLAFGYAIPGGLSQYVVIGKEILDGDEGCYLLPVKTSTGFAEAALVEPWTCVTAAYQIRARTQPRTGGHLTFVGFAKGQIPLDLGGLEAARPAVVSHSGLSDANLKAVEELAGKSGARLVARGSDSGIAAPADIVCAGTPDRESFAALVNEIDADGVLGVHTSAPEASLPVDVGKVHYRKLELVGSTDGGVARSYRANNRENLLPGARAWFVGGAGPMGQMHVIKAIMDEKGPGHALVSDLSDDRLASLKHLVSLLTSKRQRQVTLEFENPKDLPEDELEEFLRKRFPGGFEDVVVLVPVAAIISQAAHFVAPGGVLNIFAGVKVGTIADLPLAAIVRDHVRVIGSSGSPLSAMRDTLALTEGGQLSTSYSLAAVGDMGSAGRGLKALMDNTYTGKVVIFPFAHGMGLRSLKELARELPELSGRLLDGQYWTREAEDVFFKSKFFS